MDSVRTAKRLGAERAIIVYRRSRAEMPARVEEVHHAEEEGIEFINLANPIEYFADEKGKVNRMRVQRMGLGEPDASGRRRPIVLEGSEYDIPVDLVVPKQVCRRWPSAGSSVRGGTAGHEIIGTRDESGEPKLCPKQARFVSICRR